MMASLEPVALLEQGENRRVAGSIRLALRQVETRALVDRKVKSLLNTLTADSFDSVSDQLIEWANKSEQEKDGSTLMQVIGLISEKAKDEAALSEMYARLCRKMMERVSPNVRDGAIRNAEGQPITGGLLFRRYLLQRCQEDFERGWSTGEATMARAASKPEDDMAAGRTNGEAILHSDEHYATTKARRQGLGLVRFIGELFKLQMLTERIMHECIKKLLSNVVDPKEEEIESLCELFRIIGQSLDTPKARTHMDIYFERMQEMARGSHISLHMQFMLQDVIELRQRRWRARSATSPDTIHIDESGPSERLDEGRGQKGGGWSVIRGASAVRPLAKAGNLSQFGKISKLASLSFGPNGVFNKKDSKSRDPSSHHISASMNKFAVLGAAGTDGPFQPNARGGTANHELSDDPGLGGSPAVGSVDERLDLLPRTKADTGNEAVKSDDEGMIEPAVPASIFGEDAQKRVKADVEKYLVTEDLEEAIAALQSLPIESHHLFVSAMVVAALNGGDQVLMPTEKLFAAIRGRDVCSAESFERGLLPIVEMANDMSTDVPKTYEWLARLMRAAGTKRIQAKNMSKKIVVRGEVWVQPKDLLMQEFDKVVLEEREREEKERREVTERERIKREEVDRAEREEAEARARAEQEASLKSESAEANSITKQDRKPSSSSRQPQMDLTRSESSAFSESSEQSELVQRSLPNLDYNEQTVKECIKTCLVTQDIEQATTLFQEIPNNHQHAFIKDCIAAAFQGGSDSVTVIESLFKAARTQGICTPNIFQRGFVPAVESADDTSMNRPRIYEWLARLMHAAELTKARMERLAEGIAVDGKPRLEPKYLLAYEFEKLLG